MCRHEIPATTPSNRSERGITHAIETEPQHHGDCFWNGAGDFALHDAQAALKDAQDAAAADPTNPDLAGAVDAAQQAVDTAQSDADAAQDAADTAQATANAASEEADKLEADAIAALNIAANKTPVDEETREALDKLLEGKIQTPSEEESAGQ